MFLYVIGQIQGNPKESTKQGSPAEPMSHTRSAYLPNSISLVSCAHPRKFLRNRTNKVLSRNPYHIPERPIQQTLFLYFLGYTQEIPKESKEQAYPTAPHDTYQICLSNKLCFSSSLNISKEFPRNQKNKVIPRHP